MPRVLVTGGMGLIGTAVVQRLLENNYTVIATWHNRPPSYFHEQLQWIQTELCAEAQAAMLAKQPVSDISGIIHTSALIPASFESSQAEAAGNWAMDQAIFELAETIQVPLVYFSSTAVYGPHTANLSGNPISESAQTVPKEGYIAEKCQAEQQGIRMSQQSRIPFSALRICAPYGPKQQTKTVMSLFIDRALRAEPLLYHGSGSREQVFTFVDDIAQASLLALDGPGGVYNITGGQPITMKQLAYYVAEATGLSPEQVRPSGKSDDQEGFLARYSCQLAKEKLGWFPKVNLQDGIHRCIEHRKAGVCL